VIFAMYLNYAVDVRLVFWNQNDLFLWNLRFAAQFVVAAGQPSEWLGKLLLQVCHSGWLGTLAITLLVGILFVLGQGVLTRMAPQARRSYAWMVPAVLLLLLHSHYGYAPSNTVGLVFALSATWLYLLAAGWAGWQRLSLFVAISVVLYYLAGRTYVLFAGCCLVVEFGIIRKPALGLVQLVVAAAVPVGIDRGLAHLNATLWHVELPETSYLIDAPPAAWLQPALYAYYPACMVFLAVLPRLLAARERRRQAASRSDTNQQVTRTPRTEPASAKWGDATSGSVQQRKPRSQRGRHWPRWRATLRTAAPYLLLVVASVVGIAWLAPRTTRQLLAIDWAAEHHDWQGVLQAAAGLPPGLYADYANQDVDLALYHLGRLPSEMFAYPQLQLFADHGFGSRGRLFSRKAFDLFLELGRVNEAEAIAHNDWESHPSAAFLMRGALTKLIKGQSNAARVYLNVLRDDLTYGAWAEDYLERLRQDPELNEPEILCVRSRMITADDAHLTQVRLPGREWSVSAEKTLASLLTRNPANRMAFEYLMAVHLLNKDLAAVVAQLPRLQALSYPDTPLLYEEAALLYARDHRTALQMTARGAVVAGCPISDRTLNRFQRLVDIGNMHRGFANPSAREAVRRDLGPTYFSFYLFDGN